MAREARDRKICFASCVPQITHPHIHGIDLASISGLIPFTRDEEETDIHIGAHKVVCQALDDLKQACAVPSRCPDEGIEVGVFCGSVITPAYEDCFEHLDRIGVRSKEIKVLKCCKIYCSFSNGHRRSKSYGRHKRNRRYSKWGRNPYYTTMGLFF